MFRSAFVILVMVLGGPAFAQEELTPQDNQFIEQLDASAQELESTVQQDVQTINPNVTVTGPTHIESVTKQDGKIIIEYGVDE